MVDRRAGVGVPGALDEAAEFLAGSRRVERLRAPLDRSPAEAARVEEEALDVRVLPYDPIEYVPLLALGSHDEGVRADLADRLAGLRRVGGRGDDRLAEHEVRRRLLRVELRRRRHDRLAPRDEEDEIDPREIDLGVGEVELAPHDHAAAVQTAAARRERMVVAEEIDVERLRIDIHVLEHGRGAHGARVEERLPLGLEPLRLDVGVVLGAVGGAVLRHDEEVVLPYDDALPLRGIEPEMVHGEGRLSRAAQSEEDRALVFDLFRFRVEGADDLASRVNAEPPARAGEEAHLFRVHRHPQVALLHLAEVIAPEDVRHAARRVAEYGARVETETLRDVPPLGDHDEHLIRLLLFASRGEVEDELVPHHEEPGERLRDDRAAVVAVLRMETHLLVHDEELDARAREILRRRLDQFFLALVRLAEEYLGERRGAARHAGNERGVAVLRKHVGGAARRDGDLVPKREFADGLARADEPPALARVLRDLRRELPRRRGDKSARSLSVAHTTDPAPFSFSVEAAEPCR